MLSITKTGPQSTLAGLWGAMMLASSLVAVPAAAAPIFVAPNGNDQANGTRSRPFASLQRAQQAARAARARGESIEVILRGGTYELNVPLLMDKSDSGTAANPTVWRAADKEEVRVSGGRSVTQWRPVADATVRARLDPKVRDKVLQSDLKVQGITDFGDMSGGFSGRSSSTGLELFFDDAPMHISRYPNEGFISVSEVLGATPITEQGTKGTKEGVLRVQDARVARWATEKDPRVQGYWYWDWADERQKIASVDPATLTLTLAAPHHVFGYRKGQYFYGFNLLSEIDAPGEWYLDRETGIAYALPLAGQKPRRAMATVLPSILSINGASHISLRGLIFEGARENAILINNSENCILSACTIRNSGQWAVRIEGGRNCVVRGCDIYGMGDGGVSLIGGDRNTLTSAHHVAENCHIHHYSRWNRTYKPAVELIGVGNRAMRNLIHHAPHEAMGFSGNDHLIEGNEIHNVCEETNDAGAIYAGRDWSMRGNLIRNNYLHHIYGREGEGANGVYLDDNFSSATIEGNIFEAQVRPIHIGGGRDNRVLNNLFIDCLLSLHVDGRGLGWRSYGFDELKTKLEQTPYTKPPWNARYPELPGLLADQPMAPKGNVIARNILINSPWDDIDSNAKPFVTMTDNLFEAPRSLLQNDSFGAKKRPQSTLRPPRLNLNAPELQKIGFRPIIENRLGLYADKDRASWPAIHRIDVRAWPRHSSATPSLHPVPPPRVARVTKAPRVDGAASANEYPGAPLLLAETPNRDKLDTPPGRVWLAHDGQRLYVAVSIPIANPNTLVAEGNWGAADAIELIFRHHAPAPGPTFVLQGFASGSSRFSLDAGAPGELSEALHKATRYAAKIGAHEWTAEWSVPLAAAGISFQQPVTLGFNIGARRIETVDWLVWAGTKRENWRLDSGGRIVLDDK